jgi:uncharacterized SAM-binding protein YcdF (DUF218 family)
MKNKWTNKRALKLFAVIFVITAVADIIFAKIYYDKVQLFISSQQKNIKADAGIIFFGDATPDGKALGPDSKNRAETGIKLLNGNKIKTIICVGGNSREILKKPKNLMRNYLIKKGVPIKKIIYDSTSFNTITNWEAGKRILDDNGFSSAIIISAPLHIYRIAHTLDFEGRKVYFASFSYRLNTIGDYVILLKDIHHEWISLTLNKVLNDKVRNKLVFIIRDIKHKIKNLFLRGNDTGLNPVQNNYSG